MSFVACKLPAGLVIDHNGQRITLVGGNIGEDLGNVSRNGQPNDHERRAAGYGITELNGAQSEAFEDWKNTVCYVDGKKDAGNLTHPFPAFENHSIVGPFKMLDEARKEAKALAGAGQTSGFEGLDEEEEAKKTGVTKADNKK